MGESAVVVDQQGSSGMQPVLFPFPFSPRPAPSPSNFQANQMHQVFPLGVLTPVLDLKPPQRPEDTVNLCTSSTHNWMNGCFAQQENRR